MTIYVWLKNLKHIVKCTPYLQRRHSFFEGLEECPTNYISNLEGDETLGTDPIHSTKKPMRYPSIRLRNTTVPMRQLNHQLSFYR
jgi:hypothetical protein